MDRGLFVISLDFELFWGIHDAMEIKDYYENVYNVRFVIPKLLELFRKYKIKVTFAVVGAIYHNSYNAFVEYTEDVIQPQYKKSGLSPYEKVNLIKVHDHPELHFAPDLIKQIREAGHEIGTHTYSHYYSTEQGANLSSFESDIRKAVRIAKQNGDDVKSIIFPRNQLGNNDFLNVIRKYGITSYRGNPYENYSGMSPLTRIYRFCSSYLPFSNETVEIKYENGIINIPASHFLRPYSSIDILNTLQLWRIKRSMRKAAKEKKVYHLWWHPHNFGKNTEKNLVFLEEVLRYYSNLNKEYGFTSISMKQ